MCGAFDQHYHLCVLIVRLHEHLLIPYTQLHTAQLACFNMMLHETLSLVANVFQPILYYLCLHRVYSSAPLAKTGSLQIEYSSCMIGFQNYFLQPSLMSGIPNNSRYYIHKA